jgi:hypothetical protein
VRSTDAISFVAAGFLALSAQESLPAADAVLAELEAGNAHHVAKKYERPHQTAARQRVLASGQSPHCAILACADSRVPPEILFDQGLGDIFDVRVAGKHLDGSRGSTVSEVGSAGFRNTGDRPDAEDPPLALCVAQVPQ